MTKTQLNKYKRKAKAQRDNWKLRAMAYRTALELIANHGGKEVDGLRCNGGWCAEQARCALDSRCPTCRQRNSRAGERKMDDGSVIAWHCNVPGCENHIDYQNVAVRRDAIVASPSTALLAVSESGDK